MTTLSQVDLPKDAGIMSTTYRHNDVGVYAKVLQGGKISRDDRVVPV
jgi:MOSC domain-containing protein YiiM